MTAQLGRLDPLDPRSVWAHEAREFTPWLLSNADALSAVLGIDLELGGAEHPVGGFLLDLVGRDLTNDCVLIVENQLTPTDHSHLGQLVTYAAGTDAGTVAWLATTIREEQSPAVPGVLDPLPRARQDRTARVDERSEAAAVELVRHALPLQRRAALLRELHPGRQTAVRVAEVVLAEA